MCMSNLAITIDQLQEDKQGPKQKAGVSDYVQGLGKSLPVNTGAAVALWGRASDLIKQTYCV